MLFLQGLLKVSRKNDVVRTTMMGKYRMERKRRRGSLLLGGILLILVVGGCGRLTVHPDIKPTAPSVPFVGMKTLSRLAYSIQAGAFTRVENAAHLTRSLQQKGLNATYFVAAQGLYKVRFGNFPSREQARERAEDLRARGIIILSHPRNTPPHRGMHAARLTCAMNWYGPPGALSVFHISGEEARPKPVSTAAD